MPAEDDPAAAMEGGDDGAPQQFCLRWNKYQSNLTNCFDQLLQTESLVDVTLACDGKSLKAHKVMLSACSPYFQTLFMENPCPHPIIIMRDVNYCDLKAVVDFMYRGEINVLQDQIPALLKVAGMLKIRGLADVSGEPGPEVHAEAAAAAAKRPAEEAGPASGKARRRGTGSPGSERSQGPSPRRSPAMPGSAPDAPPPEPQTPPHAAAMPPMHPDDIDIRPGIAEMIREEERAKLMENSHAWLGASTSSIADSYQYQLQSMWQKCWNTNQSLVHNLRFRERGPLKSWRPETMAEAIFSVLKEGLSLSQAARKYDIPYPTFVLYANRVHNMLGPSADGGADLRPKGRGRPQRILLGVWPDEHIRGVIRAVVFRDTHAHVQHVQHAHAPHHIKEENMPIYPAITDGTSIGVPTVYGAAPCGNGRDGGVSPSAASAAAAAAVAAVAHGLRRQMCSMVAAQRPAEQPALLSLPPLPSPLPVGMESPLCSPQPPGLALEPPKPSDPFRPFASPRPDSRYSDFMEQPEMGPPRTPVGLAKNGKERASPLPVKMEQQVGEARGEHI